MKERIRQRARELGFDDCRFTTADAPETAAQFMAWLADQQQGEMAWLERNAPKRINPQLVLPGARSLIVLAASYHLASATRSDAPGPTGIVARYAQHQDYHDVLAERLRPLTDYVNEIGGPGTCSRWYVDTGPILERDFARRAGLGFTGKHTNLISRSLGNWIFLAEILTTAELIPDAPERNHCGSCTRCIVSCPTGAITAPFQLDARRCISYLTIELKGPIPEVLRPALGNRIYGCDDCLAACPWNRFAREGALMSGHRRDDLAAPELVALLALTETEFKTRFAGSPILRTKRRGLLRNVCVALGNVGGRNELPALERAAADSEPLIAEHARWAIAQIEARGERNGATTG